MSDIHSVGSLHLGLRKFSIIKDPTDPKLFQVDGMRIEDFALACQQAHNDEKLKMSINEEGVGVALRYFRRQGKLFEAILSPLSDPPVRVRFHESGGKVFAEIVVLRN